MRGTRDNSAAIGAVNSKAIVITREQMETDYLEMIAIMLHIMGPMQVQWLRGNERWKTLYLRYVGDRSTRTIV